MGESFEQLCKLGHFDPKMGYYDQKFWKPRVTKKHGLECRAELKSFGGHFLSGPFFEKNAQRFYWAGGGLNLFD